MPEFAAGFVEFFTGPALIGSAVLGVVIGAFYKWQHRDGTVATLAVVGMGFGAVVASVSFLTDDAHSAGNVGARGVLWLVVCVGMVAGQQARLRFEHWRLARRGKMKQ